MPYRFVKQKQDYTDFAAGRVLYALPGHPAFPVRLASEVFQRCLSIRAANHSHGPCLVFDPCCGGAYPLTALGYLHPENISRIAASDIDPDAIALARRNLSLLTLEGLELRIAELRGLYTLYGKESHAGALESARSLRKRLEGASSLGQLATRIFQANAADPQALRHGLDGWQADILLTDIPYGRLTGWQGEILPAGNGSLTPVGSMLEALRGVFAPGAVIAVAADKGQKIEHPAYHQVGKLRHGIRQVVFLVGEGEGG